MYTINPKAVGQGVSSSANIGELEAKGGAFSADEPSSRTPLQKYQLGQAAWQRYLHSSSGQSNKLQHLADLHTASDFGVFEARLAVAKNAALPRASDTTGNRHIKEGCVAYSKAFNALQAKWEEGSNADRRALLGDDAIHTLRMERIVELDNAIPARMNPSTSGVGGAFGPLPAHIIDQSKANIIDGLKHQNPRSIEKLNKLVGYYIEQGQLGLALESLVQMGQEAEKQLVRDQTAPSN